MMIVLIVNKNTVTNVVVCERLEDVPLGPGETVEPSPGNVGIGWTRAKDGTWQPPEPQGQPAPEPGSGSVEVELAQLRAIVDDLVMTQLTEEETYAP